jgi:hypothetical protein
MAELKKEYSLKLDSGLPLIVHCFWMKVRIQWPQTVPLPADKGIEFAKVDRTRNKRDNKNTWVPRWNKIVRDKKLRTTCICNEIKKYSRVADPDLGSGAFLTPGLRSGIRNRFFSGSRIPNPYFWELSDNFWGTKCYNSLKFGPNLVFQLFRNKIIFNFVKFVATKKGLTTNFFSPLSFVAVFRSGIRDPGSGINIPDPQHSYFPYSGLPRDRPRWKG